MILNRARSFTPLGMTAEFNKIAAVSDGENNLFTQAFGELEEFSNTYIQEMLKIGGYPASYPWPVDNLHNWSRWWEYSFVWLHLQSLVGKEMKVLDIGPALTFWPFFLAHRGFLVAAIDVDRRIKSWTDIALEKLTCLDSSAKRRLKFVTGDITKTNFKNNSFDAVTNISVIEHIDDKRLAIEEIYRLLTPGGKLINTLDISLDGLPVGDSRPLKPSETYGFIELLETVFKIKIKFGLTHPMDIVTPGRYPNKYTDSSLYVSKLHLARQIWKLAASRLSIRFLFNPNRLDMWTVAGIAVRKTK